MKVLHICQRDDPATGGAGRVAVELARRLPEFGIDAKCVFLYGPSGAFSVELPGRCLHLHGAPGSQIMSTARRLRKVLKKEQPDIIHHHDGLTWTHIVTNSWRKAKCVGHGHLTAPPPTASWKHRLAGWVQRRTYDQMICVSTCVAKSWQQSGFPADQIDVIPNGVDTSVFVPATTAQKKAARRHLQLPEDAQIISYVGRLHNEVKRCDDFVRTLALLPKEVWGVMAGSGPDEENLRRLAIDLGVSDRLRFAGLLNPATVCYQASDIFVMTSAYEPFGLVVLEATACGVSAIGFAADGGVTELLECVGATVLHSRSPDLMAQAVSKMLDARGSYDPAGIRDRSRVCENYSWKTVVQKVAARYSALVCRS